MKNTIKIILVVLTHLITHIIFLGIALAMILFPYDYNLMNLLESFILGVMLILTDYAVTFLLVRDGEITINTFLMINRIDRVLWILPLVIIGSVLLMDLLDPEDSCLYTLFSFISVANLTSQEMVLAWMRYKLSSGIQSLGLDGLPRKGILK